MSNKVFWGLVAGLIAIPVIYGVFFSGNDADLDTNSESNTAISSEPLILSEATNEKVRVVEYSDFECPACGFTFPLVQQAKQQFKEEATFEFRHFPLTQIHPSAMEAHRIAQAAANQGKFVEVHDVLFINQEAWTNAVDASDEIYRQIEQAGIDIDIDQLRSDSQQAETLSEIKTDQAEGSSDNVSGTPTFFVNGEKITYTSYEEFAASVQEAIDAVQ